jgi:hypothetical protein
MADGQRYGAMGEQIAGPVEFDRETVGRGTEEETKRNGSLRGRRFRRWLTGSVVHHLKKDLWLISSNRRRTKPK